MGTVRARLPFFWLEVLLKFKPYEKLKNLKFSKNLKIWLEILLKIKPNEKYENLKFWLQTTTWNRLLLKSFLKNTYPQRDFNFLSHSYKILHKKLKKKEFQFYMFRVMIVGGWFTLRKLRLTHPENQNITRDSNSIYLWINLQNSIQIAQYRFIWHSEVKSEPLVGWVWPLGVDFKPLGYNFLHYENRFWPWQSILDLLWNLCSKISYHYTGERVIPLKICDSWTPIPRSEIRVP